MRLLYLWVCPLAATVLLGGCDPGPEYSGALKDGKPHGQGTLTWPDGKKYIGEFRDGERHGLGETTWPDGQKYVGEWQSDKRHGRGTMTWSSGEKYSGGFVNGKRCKPLIYKSPHTLKSPYEPGGREFESLRARHS